MIWMAGGVRESFVRGGQGTVSIIGGQVKQTQSNQGSSGQCTRRGGCLRLAICSPRGMSEASRGIQRGRSGTALSIAFRRCEGGGRFSSERKRFLFMSLGSNICLFSVDHHFVRGDVANITSLCLLARTTAHQCCASCGPEKQHSFGVVRCGEEGEEGACQCG